jgi:hypothetical protein
MNFRGARAIPDQEQRTFVESLNVNYSLYDSSVSDKFISAFTPWITGGSNSIVGLETFNNIKLCHGSAQAFDHFYIKNHTRRFRTLTGDFMYHRAVLKHGFEHCYIEDDPLTSYDAVILSLPFSDFGRTHHSTHDILDWCDELKIPVLIDMAYVVAAKNINIDLSHPCIDAVTFSMSKFFYGAEQLRVGLRYQRENSDDGIDVFNSVGMNNRIDVAIAYEIINNYGPDYLWNRWGNDYARVIKELNLTSTDTILFGLTDDSQYKSYNRGNFTTRLCISDLIPNV